MSKEKQIEKIAQDICGWCNVSGVCILDGKKCDLKCTHRDIAETIYTAGYRKQSEVIKEFVKRFEKHIGNCTFTMGQTNDIQYALKKAA